jgi:nucleotide-binding universal stress UspA family protein
MKKIIVPVDFSAPARKALHSAKEFAEVLNAELEVVFFWHPHFDAADPNRLAPQPDLFQLHRKQMDQLIASESLDPNAASVEMGFPAESLVERSKEADVDLIIMGARGEHGALDKLFGTVSSHVSLHAHCPVLIIPDDAPPVEKINKIVYGLEFPYADEPSVRKVADFAHKVKASLHFVHVVDVVEEVSDSELQRMYDGIFDTLPNDQTFQLVTIMGDEEVLEGLEAYAKENDGDLLVLVARTRSWWQRLLFPNRTRRLALETDMPLLVLHADGQDHD